MGTWIILMHGLIQKAESGPIFVATIKAKAKAFIPTRMNEAAHQLAKFFFPTKRCGFRCGL